MASMFERFARTRVSIEHSTSLPSVEHRPHADRAAAGLDFNYHEYSVNHYSKCATRQVDLLPY